MTYDKLVFLAKIAAIIAALAVAFGATLGLHEISGSWLIAVPIGIVLAVVVGITWHLLIGAAQYARRPASMIGLFLAGVLLVGIAIAANGWSLVTAVGGKSALVAHQVETINQYGEALDAAYAQVQGQRSFVDLLGNSGAAARALAAEEGRSGQGPNYRSLINTGNAYDGLFNEKLDALETADDLRVGGERNLQQAREALGSDLEFVAALNATATSIRELALLDLTAGIESAGMVGINARGLSEAIPLTQALAQAAEDIEVAPVAVPVYERLTRGEAVLRHADRATMVWIVAIALDLLPLVLLSLVILLYREPLLRFTPEDTRKSDDEIRVREDNVIGIKGAAE